MTDKTAPDAGQIHRLSRTLGQSQQSPTTPRKGWLTLYKDYIFTICYQDGEYTPEGFLMAIKKLDDGRYEVDLDLAVATENASAGNSKEKLNTSI